MARDDGDATARLEARLSRLEQENQDLSLALSTAMEHGDAVQDLLHATNEKLAYEVEERRAAERRLEMLLATVRQQKLDLELLVDVVAQHGDRLDESWQSEIARIEAELYADKLTGIANRRAFDIAFERQWVRSQRQRGWLALLMIDVDFFKSFNDGYGHQAGDDSLIQVGSVLRQVCRRPDDLPARYGGEEFTVILPDADPTITVQVAERIHDLLAERAIEHEGSPFGRLTVSIGTACRIPQPDSTRESLLASADRHLYFAKQSGRNRSCHEST